MRRGGGSKALPISSFGGGTLPEGSTYTVKEGLQGMF